MSRVGRVANLFSRARIEREIDEELQAHIALRIDDNLAAGMTQEEARRDALLRFGNRSATREHVASADVALGVNSVFSDVRYAGRQLRRSPGFTVTAVLTLALAIGANAVVFSVLNAFLLKPLNVARPQSLFGIWRLSDNSMAQSYPDYVDLRDRNHSFTDLVAYAVDEVGLDAGADPIRVWTEETSGNYFDALGVQPFLGRVFHASDERGPDSAPYVVLTYAFWRAHFQDDRSVVGRVVRINKHPFTIVGVSAPEFHGTLLFFNPDIFVPVVNHGQLASTDDLKTRGNRWIFMTLGHLKPGVTQAQAIADLNAIGADLTRIYPKDDPKTTYTLARPSLYGDYVGRPARQFLSALMLMAGLILLAACANLGSLFTARAGDRSREVALRLALGSSRRRILRGLFTEALMISVAGGALGLSGSVLLLRALSVWQPISRWPLHLSVIPDATVYGMALLLALGSGLLFGAVPVRQVLRTNPYEVVKAGLTGTQAARRGWRITARDLLLVVQIAICGVLVTSSMVAVRGLARSLHDHFGFDLRNTLLVETDVSMSGYTGARAAALQKRMMESVQKIGGVEAVGMADQVPLGDGASDFNVFHDDTANLVPANAAADALQFSVSPEYFRAAATAVLAGRVFTPRDDKDAPRVAVVNPVFARKVCGAEARALGCLFKMKDGSHDAVRIQVVGLVEQGKYGMLTEDPKPVMFLPLQQFPNDATWMVVRSRLDAQQLGPAIRRALKQLDDAMPVYIETRMKALDPVLFGPRMATIALGVLGVLGALLSITGIFGMAAYAVSQRLRELGIRVALGAKRREVVGAALSRALKVLAIGSAGGLALGILASPVLAFVVYQATPRDPIVLAAVVFAMALLGLVATWIPAQRALSVDPMRLLREE